MPTLLSPKFDLFTHQCLLLTSSLHPVPEKVFSNCLNIPLRPAYAVPIITHLTAFLLPSSSLNVHSLHPLTFILFCSSSFLKTALRVDTIISPGACYWVFRSWGWGRNKGLWPSSVPKTWCRCEQCHSGAVQQVKCPVVELTKSLFQER